MTRKKFRDLNLSNAFLFAAAMADPETCRLMLEIIMSKPVAEVSVRTEHSILLSSDFRSVRLDVFAEAKEAQNTGDSEKELQVEQSMLQVDYNVEMQNEKKGNIAKRSRYYQSEMDVASLKPGEDIDDLRPNYVIFICTYDPFDRGLYRYTFENRCLENGFPLEDGTMKIFLNTRGTNPEEVPGVLTDFLKYVADSTDSCANAAGDERIRQLHDKVQRLKESREWEGRYMKFEELLQDAKRDGKTEGKIEGKIEGRDEMADLIRCMDEAGESEQIPRLGRDRAFLEEMLEKYHLND